MDDIGQMSAGCSLTDVKFICNDLATVTSEPIVINFLPDKGTTNGSSAARREWNGMKLRFPRQIKRIFRHIQRVDAAGSSSPTLAQATRDRGSPELYSWGSYVWFSANSIVAFYTYDGVNLVIVLVGRVAHPPSWHDLHSAARQRL